MKTKLFLFTFGLLALAGGVIQAAQLSTAINYQGRLTDGGIPANGIHSFKYRLVADPAGTTQIGPLVDLPNQNVAAGLFNAPLDFGAGAFNGQERWLEISVKTGGPGAAQDYVKLNPQPLPPGGSSQYARLAGDVLDGAITAPKLAPLAITSGNLADGAVTTAKISDGSITAADIGNNQVVKSVSVNGSGNLRDTVNLVAGQNIALSPSGNTVTISSSGTAGSLWTAPGGGSIFYNGGNVGIGTATPQSRLHIIGDNLTTGRLIASKNADEGGELLLHNPRKTGAAADYWKLFNMTGTYGDSFQLWSYPASGGAIARFRINDDGTTILAPSGGNVGIGTPAPSYPLEVFNANDTAIAGRSGSSSAIGATIGINLANGTGVFGESRGQGVGVFGRSVTGEAVHGESSSAFASVVGVNLAQGAGIYGESRSGGYGVFGKSVTGEAVHGESSSTFAAVVGLNLAAGHGVYGESRGGGYGGYFLGRVRVGVLEIAGGADLAEPFPMKEDEIDKGSVVVIDEEHPGRLKLSTRAYDTQVAGIISGANGISPGISLTQEGALDQGQNVALTGRVYVKADASHGTIKPGDLLTTSDTPGHAMKVNDHTRSQGAILGKAMSALKEGQGLVLVLVTLQ